MNHGHDEILHLLHLHGRKLDAILTLLAQLNPGKAVDLEILFQSLGVPTKGNVPMAKKATGAAFQAPMRAVMPDITLTDPLPKSVTLQPVDAHGAPVNLTPADTVTGTLTSDNAAALAVAPGADSLHYTATIPANTPTGSVANLAATLKGTVKGAPADLKAAVKVTINLPPSPVAVDLEIIFG